MCELLINAEELRTSVPVKGGERYHKLCHDIAVANLTAELKSALRAQKESKKAKP